MVLLWILLQNMVLWKYEMTQWAGISLNWINGFVHTCAFMQNIFIILYTNSIQSKLDHCKTNINKDKIKKQISKESQDFMTEVLFPILKISESSWKQDTKNQLAQQILWSALLVETCSPSFCSNELHTLSCMWPSAGNGFH